MPKRQILKWTDHIQDIPVGYVQVAQRRADLIVTEQPHNHGNVGSAIQQMGRKAVPQRMNAPGLEYPGPPFGGRQY